MNAAQISQFGAPEVLRLNDVDRPTPMAGQVLVAVHAASVNGHDAAIRAGQLKLVSGRSFPIGLGLDFVGTVAAPAPSGTPFEVGDRVWGTVHPRKRHATAAFAQFLVVDSERLAPAPTQLSDPDGASLVVAGSTALTALRDVLRLKAGERVLIRGAAGGVGTAAVQLAHSMGAQVTALARDQHAAELRALGADHVLDRTSTAAHDVGPFDVILDLVGTDLRHYRRRLTKHGRMATVALSGPAIPAIAASLVHGPRRIRTFSADPTMPLLNDLAALVSSGALRATIEKTYPLTEIAQAHTAFDRGGTLGKHVITMKP